MLSSQKELCSTNIICFAVVSFVHEYKVSWRQANGRTDRLILLGTRQELERPRVARNTCTIKKWIKIMKLVQNVVVIGEVERK
jgi:hypothetical protein